MIDKPKNCSIFYFSLKFQKLNFVPKTDIFFDFHGFLMKPSGFWLDINKRGSLVISM
jgi:hypothetical protein